MYFFPLPDYYSNQKQYIWLKRIYKTKRRKNNFDWLQRPLSVSRFQQHKIPLRHSKALTCELLKHAEKKQVVVSSADIL